MLEFLAITERAVLAESFSKIVMPQLYDDGRYTFYYQRRSHIRFNMAPPHWYQSRIDGHWGRPKHQFKPHAGKKYTGIQFLKAPTFVVQLVFPHLRLPDLQPNDELSECYLAEGRMFYQRADSVPSQEFKYQTELHPNVMWFDTERMHVILQSCADLNREKLGLSTGRFGYSAADLNAIIGSIVRSGFNEYRMKTVKASTVTEIVRFLEEHPGFIKAT